MNKRMKKLAVVLTGVLALSSLTGCSGGPAKSSAKGASQEPVELVWWLIGNEPKDLELVNEEINKYTKEKLNTTIKFRYASWGEYGDKLSKIIQGGEDFDIAFGSSINGYMELANKGYFADLTEVIPEKAPLLDEFIVDELWKAVTVKGKVFGVPTFKDSAQSQYWVWDKELVEELDIDYKNIKTLEDLEPALVKIKEARPSTYPLILAGTEGVNGFFPAVNRLDIFSTQIGVRVDDPTATVISAWEDEALVENLRTLHRWFKQGLINPDAATLTESPKYKAVFSAQGYPHADADWVTSCGYPVVSSLFADPLYSTGTIQGSFQVISAGSKHIEEAVKVLELFNTDSYARNLLAFGIEGKHYEKTGDNTIKILNDDYQVPSYSQATFFNMYAVDPAPAEKWTDLQKHMEKAISSPALGVTFDSQPVQNEVAACSNIIDKYMASLMTGSVDPDETIPKLLDELNNAGYQDIKDELQKQIDEFLGK